MRLLSVFREVVSKAAMRAVVAVAVALLTVSGCAHPKPAPPPDLHTARLDAADAQVRAGCLDCLIGAYREYIALRGIPAAAERATIGAVRAAALAAVRERELGMVDEGYLQRARDAAAGHPEVPAALLTVLDVVDATAPSSVGAGRPTSDTDLERMRVVRVNRDKWTEALRAAGGADVAAAYTWLAFTCASSDTRAMSRDDILGVIAPFANLPLIEYRKATCRAVENDTLQRVLAVEPRFREIDYTRGQAFMARRRLDDADAAFDRALQWHPAWPTLTLAIANVAMTSEEFERALAMYEETLKYEPLAVDARLGKVKALTYLGRHVDAIATVDELLAQRWYVGDARYWRAVNETNLERYDDAWVDIELAAKLLVNAEVPKLAGLIAYHRGELEVSRAKFDESAKRNPGDCETGYYLGLVLGELKQWARAVQVVPAAAACLERAAEQARLEIEEIRASEDPPARKARKIAKREQTIAVGRRWIATSWFNTAVAFYNLARPADARPYAEKVVDDEAFGERARELLSRLGK
jgi:tetratricopeptide (TPR) repeat protein